MDHAVLPYVEASSSSSFSSLHLFPFHPKQPLLFPSSLKIYGIRKIFDIAFFRIDRKSEKKGKKKGKNPILMSNWGRRVKFLNRNQ